MYPTYLWYSLSELSKKNEICRRIAYTPRLSPSEEFFHPFNRWIRSSGGSFTIGVNEKSSASAAKIELGTDANSCITLSVSIGYGCP